MATSSTSSSETIFFGPFDVSMQVFYATPRSFALVNLKPLLPGHVLVCPRQPHRRLTDLDRDEVADLFGTVQLVQRMLARHFFGAGTDTPDISPAAGSFNLAIQDGPEAGQTVPHVHVHVIPRIRGATAKDASTEGDALYEQMAAEPGNIGGAQWDEATHRKQGDPNKGQDARTEGLGVRPHAGGQFPRIEESSRKPRTMAEMQAEATVFRHAMELLSPPHNKP